MKKFIGILVSALLMLIMSFTACSGGGNSAGGGNSTGGGSSNSTEPPKPPANKEVDGEELIQTMMSTPYRLAITNAEYGLTDASKVGADQQAFSKVLYPVPDDSEFAHVYVAADYGITKDGEKNEKNFNTLVSSLKNVEGLKKIVFEEGVYRFTTTLKINGVNDLYLVGNNTEFVFENWCIGYNVTNCENIHFNEISTDYDPSPVVSGTVKSFDEAQKSVTISLYDEFDLSDSRYNGGTISYGSYMEFAEDKNGELHPNYKANLLYNSTGDHVANITAGKYDAAANELTLTFKTVKSVSAGTPVSVAFTMYEYATYVVEDCQNVYLEGCNIYCSAGMTFMFNSVTNSYLNRTNLMLKPGSKRLMTATADGFHGNDCCGDLFITGSIYENSHDDSINICSFYKKITQNAAKQIVCESSSVHTNFPIEVGDVIEVYDPATFERKGTYTVESVNNSLLKYTIGVNKFVKDDFSGCIVGNVTRSPKVKINDCIFRNKRNRGILLQSRNCDISNNAFYNIVHGAISLHSALDIFAEAIVPGDVTVTNNKFFNNNLGYGLDGDVSVFAYGNTGKGFAGSIKNITVANNFITGNGQSGVSIKSGGNCTVSNNLFYDICRRYSNESLYAAVRIIISENITVNNNCVVMSNATESFAVVKNNDESSVTENGNQIK
ncbi:MAG: right-handed parallel beta-helix repeat-containing protein [Clostridia bacterium]|nr:right-handed parallel beta-helix repeat-containing protein [Clostridia bacterium]